MDTPTIWPYVLRLYGVPEFGPAGIALQDSVGADVDILLYLCFLADRSRQARQDDAARIDASIKAWRENVVKPVRALRRQLKDGIAPVPLAVSDPIRNIVKNIELDVERIQLEALEREFPAESMAASNLDRQALARENVMAYAATLGGFPDQPVAALLGAFSRLKPA
ncbi:MAG: TIGR02444 family protein [Burkholderiales bacterium]